MGVLFMRGVSIEERAINLAHPAEKNQVVNPMQIWNDAYTYLKTNNQDYKIERIYKRYELCKI